MDRFDWIDPWYPLGHQGYRQNINLGRPMVSEDGLEAMEARSKTRSGTAHSHPEPFYLGHLTKWLPAFLLVKSRISLTMKSSWKFWLLEKFGTCKNLAQLGSYVKWLRQRSKEYDGRITMGAYIQELREDAMAFLVMESVHEWREANHDIHVLARSTLACSIGRHVEREAGKYFLFQQFL